MKGYKDLKNRILFTLSALVVYRLGTYVPVPGVNPEILGEFMGRNLGGILGMFDMFSGGALSRMTVFALNLMPYISASIITQLLTVVFPKFEALKKEGELGRRQLGQYTRYLTVLIALAQGYGIVAMLSRLEVGGVSAVYSSGPSFAFVAVLTLLGGTLFLMWLGEQITTRGISNGSSLIIFSGIVANLPSSFINTFEIGRSGSFYFVIFVLLMVFFVIAGVVFFERAQRRVMIQYPKATLRQGMAPQSSVQHLPLKINSAGVVPPIFAGSLLMLPLTLSGFAGYTQASKPEGVMSLLSVFFAHGHPVYMSFYFFLILFFSFFYTSVIFNPSETSENLRKNGGVIPGVRPGVQTAEYLDSVLTRLTFVGAIYLSFLCLLPEFLISKFSIPFYFGGTSVLIVVSVTIETANQIKSFVMNQQYESLFKKIRKKNAKGARS